MEENEPAEPKPKLVIFNKRRRASQAQRARRGIPAGTAPYIGQPAAEAPLLRVFAYDEAGQVVRDLASPDEVACAPGVVTWLDVERIDHAETIQKICQRLDIHPLAIEDILNPATRTKVEDYGEKLFVVFKMLSPTAEPEQVSAVLGPGWLITFGERAGDVFDTVRRSIEVGTGRIRRMGADYLLHALLDAVVDGYFSVLEAIEEQVDEIEEEALGTTEVDIPRQVHALKEDLTTLKRTIAPLRDAVSLLLRDPPERLSERALPYYRDLSDHLYQVMDGLDNCRERLHNALELHLATTSHRMNENMRLLTVVTTIFIPLTFIAGIYGMNFEYMPELEHPWGYPGVLAFMLILGFGMWVWFRKRQWL